MRKNIFINLMYLLFLVQYYMFYFHNKLEIASKIKDNDFLNILVFFIVPFFLFLFNSKKLNEAYFLALNIFLLIINVYGFIT